MRNLFLILLWLVESTMVTTLAISEISLHIRNFERRNTTTAAPDLSISLRPYRQGNVVYREIGDYIPGQAASAALRDMMHQIEDQVQFHAMEPIPPHGDVSATVRGIKAYVGQAGPTMGVVPPPLTAGDVWNALLIIRSYYIRFMRRQRSENVHEIWFNILKADEEEREYITGMGFIRRENGAGLGENA